MIVGLLMWLGTPEVIPKLVIKLFALELFALRQRPIALLCSRTTRWKGLPTFRSTILEDLKGLKGVFKCEEERGGKNCHPCRKAECTNLETQAEPQQIVAQGLLSCLQYPVS